jgi:hypothetical protein
MQPFRLVALMVFISITAVAQSTPSTSPVDDSFVQKQFGESCKLIPGPGPAIADLNGDGIDDIVIVARCTNPLLDQAEHGYRVIDPYNTFFGYGNPKITTEFASEDPSQRGVALLVIHGAGPEAWRAATPKAKFLIINLPFQQIMVKKLAVRKKMVMAIYAEESGGDKTVSATFWDGKKYKYQPLGSTME